MTTRQDVERFIAQFKVKLEVFGVFFLDGREKNAQALLDLNISRFERMDVIRSIEVNDYSEGPILDVLNDYGEMWVFGKDVSGKEVYIKITMGKPDVGAICISFHVAEHSMDYPFKETDKEN